MTTLALAPPAAASGGDGEGQAQRSPTTRSSRAPSRPGSRRRRSPRSAARTCAWPGSGAPAARAPSSARSRAEPGVLEASASYAAQRASVVWDPALTRLSARSRRREASRLRAPCPTPRRRRVHCARREERSALWRLFVAVFCMMQVMMYAGAAVHRGARRRSAPTCARCCCGRPGCSASRWCCSRQRRCSVTPGRPCAAAASAWTCRSRSASPSCSSSAAARPSRRAVCSAASAYFDSLTMFVALPAGRPLARAARCATASRRRSKARWRGCRTVVRRLAEDGTTPADRVHRLRARRPGPRSRRRGVPCRRRAARRRDRGRRGAADRRVAAGREAPRRRRDRRQHQPARAGASSVPIASAPTRATKASSR